MMNNLVQFPGGVTVGRPFTGAMEGLLWLSTTGQDERLAPVVLDTVLPWADPKLMTPWLVTAPVPLLPVDGFVWEPLGASTPKDLTVRGVVAIDADGAPVDGLPDSWPATDSPDNTVGPWRQLRGLADVMRRDLPNAPDRRRGGWELGQVEQAVIVVDAALTSALNRWVTRIWTDALTAGIPVYPASPHTVQEPAGATWHLHTPH